MWCFRLKFQLIAFIGNHWNDNQSVHHVHRIHFTRRLASLEDRHASVVAVVTSWGVRPNQLIALGGDHAWCHLDDWRRRISWLPRDLYNNSYQFLIFLYFFVYVISVQCQVLKLHVIFRSDASPMQFIYAYQLTCLLNAYMLTWFMRNEVYTLFSRVF